MEQYDSIKLFAFIKLIQVVPVAFTIHRSDKNAPDVTHETKVKN